MRSPGKKRGNGQGSSQQEDSDSENHSPVPGPSTSNKRKRERVDENEGPDTVDKENDPRASKKFCPNSSYARFAPRLTRKKSPPKQGPSLRQITQNRPELSVRPILGTQTTAGTSSNNETTQMETTSGVPQPTNLNLQEFRYKRLWTNMIECLEQEFSCSICGEVLIESSGLGCSHTFCGFCINKWLETANNCPICRADVNVTNRPVKNIQLDNYISKVHRFMTSAKQTRREHLIEERQADVERERARRVLIQRQVIAQELHHHGLQPIPNLTLLSPSGTRVSYHPWQPAPLASQLLTRGMRIPNIELNALELNPTSFARAVNLLLGGNSGDIHIEFVN